jgi:hypothetical protein
VLRPYRDGGWKNFKLVGLPVFHPVDIYERLGRLRLHIYAELYNTKRLTDAEEYKGADFSDHQSSSSASSCVMHAPRVRQQQRLQPVEHFFPWTKKEMEERRNIKSNVVYIYIYISYIYVFAVKLDSVKRRTRCAEKKFAYFVDERAGRDKMSRHVKV